ncbi:MAG: RNA polymerase sigma factor [Isosphaeraceae bacterium]
MLADFDFRDCMARAKAGDSIAIREFLSRYEREVRIMVRARLPKKLRSQFDSIDFAQAVWQSFFSDSLHQERTFESEHHLCKFLEGVVRNKVFEQHRRLTRTQKYDLDREERLYVRRGDCEVPREVISPEASPSQVAQASDRLEQLTAGCSPMEVHVITLRSQGLTFAEIATQTGVNERTARRIIDSARSRMETRT